LALLSFGKKEKRVSFAKTKAMLGEATPFLFSSKKSFM